MDFRVAASAYEDVPWINCLTEFTANLIENHPRIKLVGICFGHQIVARSQNVRVVKNPLGWEVKYTVPLWGCFHLRYLIKNSD